jgi:hypothetical protein
MVLLARLSQWIVLEDRNESQSYQLSARERGVVLVRMYFNDGRSRTGKHARSTTLQTTHLPQRNGSWRDLLLTLALLCDEGDHSWMRIDAVDERLELG